MRPDQIPLGYYTHLNFAFSLIDPQTFQLVPMAPDMAAMYNSVSKLKASQESLQVWLSVGKS